MTEEKKGVLPEVIPADEMEELWEQYQTLKQTVGHIRGGAAYLSIHCPGGFTNLEYMKIKEEEYLKRIKGDLMMGLREARQQLIRKLTEEDKAELGYSDRYGGFAWQAKAFFDSQNQQRYQIGGDEIPESGQKWRPAQNRGRNREAG